MTLTDTELERLIQETPWIFAKTYAKIAPHEYIRQREQPMLFSILIKRIRKYAVPEAFTLFGNKSIYYYWHFMGYKYWEMIPNEKNVEILNRVKVKDV